MSIIRDSTSAPSSDSIDNSRNRDSARDPQRAVDPADRQRFQHLMREGQLKGQGDSQAAARKGEELAGERVNRSFPSQQDTTSVRDPGKLSAEPLPPAEVAAIWQAQNLAHQASGTTSALPAPPVNSTAFAELLERHVRQLAVSEGSASSEDGQVLLRMADTTLAGTDLLLSRTSDGWLLRADVRSRDSFDAIQQAGSQLSERFAQRGLGALTIDPRLTE
ncbi:hypothetical protein INQ40_04680 [Lysobacter sp. H21R4]|uniref:hypothetical protein n=1 Tax=Lysobacter sp. H21R4 TaxID=2781021 RepID=UPI00188952F1|nr:hypothetical protein [Lysobacter sp. H21R4]QOY63536.1 hypothetical protein INQ40_04680 [Lysobacter sp. H21R4]